MNVGFTNLRSWFPPVFGRPGLFLLGLCFQPAAEAASDTATITANIISTASLTNRTGLVFGDIASSNVAGTVVVNPDGSSLGTGGARINSTVSSGPAVFEVEGDPNAVYAITLPVNVVMTAPAGHTMVVDEFSSLPAATGLTDSGGQQLLFVGGRLNVGGNQVFGSYSGLMMVTIEYN